MRDVVIKHLNTGSPGNLVGGLVRSVADPHHLDADRDPDAAFHSDSDPDPTFHSDADPNQDSTFHSNAVPDPYNLIRTRSNTRFFPDLDPPVLLNDHLRLPPFYFDADPEPDPAFNFDADPDPAFHYDRDLASQSDPDPDFAPQK